MTIYQQPGSVNENAFTVADLLNIEHDFPESPYVYFGNSEHTVICVVSSFNPADQWCSGKPPEWTPPDTYSPAPHYVIPPPPSGFHTEQYLPPPNPSDPPVATPEPLHVAFLLAALLLSLVIRTLK